MAEDAHVRRVVADRYLRDLAARGLQIDDDGVNAESIERSQRHPFAMSPEISALRRVKAIFEAGDALVAVGAIDRQVVDEIAKQYVQTVQGRANRMADRELKVRALWTRMGPTPVEVGPVRVVPGPIGVRLAWGEITARFVRFEATRTVLSITGRLDASPPEATQRHHPLRTFQQLGRRLTVLVADDRGCSSEAQFIGDGRGEDEIEGQFTTNTALSAETAWLELNGQRIELSTHEPPVAEVQVEVLTTPPSASAYLWHRVAILGRPLLHPPLMSGLEASITALAAVGAINAADPEIDAMRDVLLALWSVPGTEPQGPLPEPWNSVVERRARSAGGMRGIIPVGVVAPAVDGVNVCVHALEASPERFLIEVELSPYCSFAWWVEDDHGHIQLGYGERIGGSPERALERATFLGGVDDGVKELSFMPTGTTTRAVVRIPVEDWLRSA